MNIKNKALLAYVVIFLVGGASGFFLNEAINPGFSHVEGFDERPVDEDFPPPKEEEAETSTRRERMKNEMNNFLAKKLDLDEDQKEPFFDLLDEHFKRLHQKISENKEEELEVIRGLYSDFLDRADEILSEHQIRELNKIAHPDSVHQRRKRRRGRDFP